MGRNLGKPPTHMQRTGLIVEAMRDANASERDLAPLAQQLAEDILRRGTKTVNPSEEIVKGALLSNNIMSYYEPYAFIASNLVKAYLPDFVTSMVIDGRPVVIERHGNCSETRMEKEKYRDMRKIYGFYMVLISSVPKDKNNIKDIDKCVDEYLFVKNGASLGKEIAHERQQIEAIIENLMLRSRPDRNLLLEKMADAIDIDMKMREKNRQMKEAKRS